MVEKCARAALDILDIPLSLCEPELAMLPAYDLGLEAHRTDLLPVCLSSIVTLGVAADADDVVWLLEFAFDGVELE